MMALERIFSKTADAVFAVNSSGRVIYGNEPLMQLCGCSRDELIGLPCYDALKAKALNGDKFCGPDCPVAQSLADNGSAKNVDVVLQRQDGLDEWVNIGALLAPPEWQPASIVFTLRPFNIRRIIDRFTVDKKENTLQKRNGLTRRELQVVRKIAQGEKVPLISEDLNICITTVRNHINNIYHKLELHSRAEIVSYAYKNNLI